MLSEVVADVVLIFGAIAAAWAAVGAVVLNGKFDRLLGRVDSLETGHNAHVNAAQPHGAIDTEYVQIAAEKAVLKILMNEAEARRSRESASAAVPAPPAATAEAATGS